MFSKITEEIKEPFYKQNFPNDGQRFVAWYLRNIHLRDMNETKDDITDGADDKQIDAIFIDDEKSTIFIIQGKFIAEINVDKRRKEMGMKSLQEYINNFPKEFIKEYFEEKR